MCKSASELFIIFPIGLVRKIDDALMDIVLHSNIIKAYSFQSKDMTVTVLPMTGIC